MIGRLCYWLLSYAAFPVLFIRLWWRGRSAPIYRQRWDERLGKASFPKLASPIWIHAVSVGEVMAASTLIRRLQQELPQYDLMVTTTTPTGSQCVQSLFGGSIAHVYLPYDIPHLIKRFVHTLAPRIAIIMETEIWPHLLAELNYDCVPVILANARLSAQSFQRYRYIQGLISPALNSFTTIATQTDSDAAHFLALGADRQRVHTLGNLKFDITVPKDTRSIGATWRKNWGNQRPTWCAASTHEGEETMVLRAQLELQHTLPDSLLILAPRHPQRLPDVINSCQQAGVSYALFSETTQLPEDRQVLLIDELGILFTCYAAVDCAFIGGSFVPIGGHNPIEPALLQCPVLSGPHVHNFSTIFKQLEKKQLVSFVQDSDELAAGLLTLLQDPKLRETQGKALEKWALSHGGATEKHVALIAELIS